jgi:hypothetical protein
MANERIDILEREFKREGKKNRVVMNDVIRHSNAISFKEEPVYKKEKPVSIANNEADRYQSNLEMPITLWNYTKTT